MTLKSSVTKRLDGLMNGIPIRQRRSGFMNHDEMKLDPNALRLAMSYIQRYSSKQQDLLRDYITKMKKLSYDWDDGKGYGQMMIDLEKVSNNAIASLEQIDSTYRKFLYDEVLDIERTLSAISLKK